MNNDEKIEVNFEHISNEIEIRRLNLEKLLWGYLLDCLAVHHDCAGSKYKTIQDVMNKHIPKIEALYIKEI